ncbi:MAG: hypothetical protein LLG04_07945 [Parachlamydia sp.]|nr:hypothetical protein [Parachlamydia sp.]
MIRNSDWVNADITAASTKRPRRDDSEKPHFLRVLEVLSPVMKELENAKYLSKEDFHELLKDFVRVDEDLLEESTRQKCHRILRTIWPGAEPCDLKDFKQHAWAAAGKQRAMLEELGKLKVQLQGNAERLLTPIEIRALKAASGFFRAIAGKSLWKEEGNVPCDTSLACFDRFLALIQGKLNKEALSWKDWVELYRFAHFVHLNDFRPLLNVVHVKMIGLTPQDLADFLSEQDLLVHQLEADAAARDLWMEGRDGLLSEYFNCLGKNPSAHFHALQAFERSCLPDREWMKMRSYTATSYFNQNYIKGLSGLTALKKLTRRIERSSCRPSGDGANLSELKYLQEFSVQGGDEVGAGPFSRMSSATLRVMDIPITDLAGQWGQDPNWFANFLLKYPSLKELHLRCPAHLRPDYCWTTYAAPFSTNTVPFKIFLNGQLKVDATTVNAPVAAGRC